MKKFTLLFVMLINASAFASVEKKAVLDPVVVEISDVTMANVYYHQVNFSVPTKLVFTNLTSVSGYIYFHQNVNLVEVDFPQLTQIGSYFYAHQNLSLTSIKLPQLQTVHRYLYVNGNTSLTDLQVCNLTQILPEDDFSDQLPYYYIHSNTPGVDATPQCFSLGGPQNLTLSNNTLAENLPVNTVIGTLHADSNYPNGSLTYSFTNNFDLDNHFFTIENNQLKANSVFDFESDNSYEISVRVVNQIGETITANFVISVSDVTGENLTVIEITDTTMDNVYYHQVSFPTPTKLVFTNLTSVTGYVYFHQNVNLVEVEFPQLTQTGRYFYAHQNLSLTKLAAPQLQTVHNYLYVNGNTSLTDLQVCNLTQILPEDQFSSPYYYIHNNTPTVDAVPFCFALGGPTNLTLSGTTVAENQVPGIAVGTLHADSNYPLGTMTYALTDQFSNDNHFFTVVGNELKTNSTFDFEAQSSYTISVKATNQIGETITSDFVITITDVASESVTVVEITDATLDNVYYHQVSFTTPTKLVFTNLTSVNGYVYFHQNVNLVEVEFPVLTQTGRYFYAHQNQSLTKLIAPVLGTVHNYLYVYGNNALTDLNVCNLAQILPTTDDLQTPYYFIQNNPLLDFSTTCLVNTTIEFVPADPIIILPAPNTLIGHFTSDAQGTFEYYFVDAAGNPTTNSNFIIIGDGLYLANEYETYQESDFVIDIGAIRVTSNKLSTSNGLNEKKRIEVSFSIDNAVLGTPTFTNKSFVLYPNPANDSFIISTDLTESSNYEIFDLNGKLLQKDAVENLKPIDIRQFQNGMYFVKITSEKSTDTYKLIKN